MRLLPSSPPFSWPAKDSLKAFVREKFERANLELLERDEWIDFGSMASESMVDRKEILGNGTTVNPCDGTSLFPMHAQDKCFSNIKLDSFREAREGCEKQPKRASIKKSVAGDSNKTLAQKLDSFTRPNPGYESAEEKMIEFDENENPFRMRKARPAGGVSSAALTPRQKIKLRFGLHDISNQPAVLKPMRGRGSFGIGKIKKLSPDDPIKHVSLDISKLSFKHKKRNVSRKSNPEPCDSPQTSKTSTTRTDDSSEMKSPESGTITSSDSDGSGFKNLVNLWNKQSPTQIPKACSKESSLKLHGAATNNSSGTEDSQVHLNDTNNCSAPSCAPRSKSPINANNSEGNKAIVTKNMPVKALVILEEPDKYDLIVGEATQDDENKDQLMIQNFTRRTDNIECDCSMSAFSGNEDLIMFFLPKVGMPCNCGRNTNKLVDSRNPTALENILRSWQVDFLASFGIHTGEEFIKSQDRSPIILAKGLRQWRKKNDMKPFKTSSCATALKIWSKVCKSYIRSIRRQTLAGQTNHELGPADATLIQEMTQFLGALPGAPSRRSKTSKNALGIELESQMEV